MRYVVPLLVIAACGGRSSLDEPGTASPPGRLTPERDAETDVAPAGADGSDDAEIVLSPPTDDGGTCSEGLNTEYAPQDGSSVPQEWFASPYVPMVDITVTSLGVHDNGGGIAILSADGNAPGSLLFVTDVPGSPGEGARWHSVAVDPPVSLNGGELYFIAQWDNGVPSLAWPPITCPVEYESTSANGSWTVTGTDCWVVRVRGTCP